MADPALKVRYRVCSKCERKRRFHVLPTNGSYKGRMVVGRQWTCSQGHVFWHPPTTTEMVTDALKAMYTGDHLRALFENNSLFLTRLQDRG